MAEGFLTVLENRTKNTVPGTARKATFKKSHLEVRMFNVGKGEAILLTFPGNRAWLLDGGCAKSLKKLGPALAAFLKSENLILEAIVLSHPHRDHGGAIKDLLGTPRLANPVTFYRNDETAFCNKTGWLHNLRTELKKLGASLNEEVILANGHIEVPIADGVEAHLFSGGATEPLYRSVFLHLHYGGARLLFTGDAYCKYECDLIARLKQTDFRADVLKVTHHGSSSGTGKGLVSVVKPGIAIASTGKDSGHSLEFDVLDRLRAGGAAPKIHETLLAGDIIIQTDGLPHDGGVLYHVEFESPGRFTAELGPEVGIETLTFVKNQREKRTPASDHKDCKENC